MLRREAGHRAIGRRRGEADGRAVACDGGREILRRGLLQQDGGRADPEGEQHQPAQAEGEGQRRRADEDIGGVRPQHLHSVAVEDRQHVAVEMQRALRLARAAAGEADQADIVGGRVAGREARRRRRAEPFELPIPPGNKMAQVRRLRLPQIFGQPRIAERVGNAPLPQHLAEFLRPQQRHAGHNHAARLQHGEIGRDHPGIIGASQQHAVAGDKAEARDEHPRDAIDPIRKLAVGEDLGRGHDGRMVAAAARDVAVEQFDGAVQAGRIAEFRPVEQQVRPLVRRRQVVAREAIEMRARRQLSASHPVLPAFRIMPLSARRHSAARAPSARSPRAGSPTRLHRHAAP